MVNTTLQAIGWFLGLLAWGAAVGMTLSERWRMSSIDGQRGDILDAQARFEGLWSSCSTYPSGQTHCSMLDIQIGEVESVVIGCRALMILATIFGLVGALFILVGFKCFSFGPINAKQKAAMSKYGGGIYFLCAICVTASAAWYIVDILTTIAFPDVRGNLIKWSSGEGVQITLAAGILWVIATGAVMLGSRQTNENRVIMYEPYKKKTEQEYV